LSRGKQKRKNKGKKDGRFYTLLAANREILDREVGDGRGSLRRT